MLFCAFCAFLWLLLDRHPNSVATAVEQRGPQKPDALSVGAQTFGVQVEVPFTVSQPELIAGCGCVGWRRIDRRV